MLLELITGRRPVDTDQSYMDDSLVDWVSRAYLTMTMFNESPFFENINANLEYVIVIQARPLLTRALEEGNFDSLIDQRLQNNYNQNEMARMVACAAACVRHSARRRPRMSQVYILVLPSFIPLQK